VVLTLTDEEARVLGTFLHCGRWPGRGPEDGFKSDDGTILNRIGRAMTEAGVFVE